MWRTGKQPSKSLLELRKASGVAEVVGVVAFLLPCLRPLLLFLGTAGVDASWAMVGTAGGGVGAVGGWEVGGWERSRGASRRLVSASWVKRADLRTKIYSQWNSWLL